MITRDDVLSQAANECMKELYSLVVPSVKWEDFKEQCKIYTKLYKEWESFNSAYNSKNENPKKWDEIKVKYENLEWEGKSITECIGPRPYEFYYLPKEIMKDVCDSYVYAYRIDQQQELLITIEILKNYCKKPIVDKWIEGKNGDSGYRGYDHPDNLEKEIREIFDEEILPDIAKEYKKKIGLDSEIESAVSTAYSQIFQDKFFKFLDMAGNFYNWNRDLNAFNTTVYLGASPCSNKEAVIKNWKEFKNKDIEINEEQIKKDYYGDDE